MDLEATGSMSKGFQGGFTDGTYGDVVPQNNSARHGEVARFTLQGFSTMAVLDLTTKDAALKGFAGGFTDGRTAMWSLIATALSMARSLSSTCKILAPSQC